MQRRTCCGHRRKPWIETPIFKSIFNPFIFYIDYIDLIIKLIQYMNASLLNQMSCIDLYLIEKVYPVFFFSIHCVNTSGLKLKFQCFQRRLRPLHCDVECFDCQMKITDGVYMYFQSSAV